MSASCVGRAPWLAAITLVFASAAVTRPVAAALTESIVASGLNSPTAMAIASDGRILVCEQNGALRLIRDGELLARPFVTVPTTAQEEEGLMGIALDPAFTSNGYVYVLRTQTSPVRRNVITRYTASGDTALPGSAVDLYAMDANGAHFHVGGGLAFMPDGTLLTATGDNADGTKTHRLDTTFGKVLRIRADGTIPTDNPWYGVTTGPYRAIWALGFRNPFTLAIQRTTGRVYVNDVGMDTWEEVNHVAAGGDHGWPRAEGMDADPNRVDPVHVYDHADGCAVVGGVFYEPTNPQLPASFLGKYFYGEYCESEIRVVDPSAPASYTVLRPTLAPGPVDLDVGPDGNLYYLARGNAGGVGGNWSSVGMVVRVGYTTNPSPVIQNQPEDQTVAVGQTATFRVVASGEDPPSYQWRRGTEDIFGAESPTYVTNPVTPSDHGVEFRCMVSNVYGSIASAPARVFVSSNAAPTASISLPASGARYDAGTSLAFAGSATDAEDGPLPDAALTWWIDFHHDTHTHPAMSATAGVSSGSYAIPEVGEASANVWYRVVLQARDSGGRTTTVTRDVFPNTAHLEVRTSPPGLQLTLDAQPVWSPQSGSAVVGVRRALGVVTPQTSNGVTYAFAGWSDGGAPSHEIRVAPGSNLFTAYFTSEDTTTLVDWSGDYVTSDAAARGSNSTVEYDVDLGGGFTGARWSCPYDPLAPLTPLESYDQGTCWRFYGGVLLESYTNTLPIKFAGIRQRSGGDAQSSAGPPGAHGWDLRYWTQPEFLGDARLKVVAFGPTGMLEILDYTGPDADPMHNTGALRFVVRDGTTFWVSEDHGAPSTDPGADFRIMDPDQRRWARFDPMGPSGIRFDPSTATFERHRFVDVTAVGYLHTNVTIPAPATGARPGVTIARFRARGRVMGYTHVGNRDASRWLRQAQPNPTSGRVTLGYELPEAMRVQLEIVDVNGRLCSRIVDDERAAGRQLETWNTRSLQPGVYVVTLRAGSRVETAKLVVTR